MCPLVKSRIAIRLIAAQPLRFWIMGKIYGAAIVKKEISPKAEVMTREILK
jgi:hypothetical protein